MKRNLALLTIILLAGAIGKNGAFRMWAQKVANANGELKVGGTD